AEVSRPGRIAGLSLLAHHSSLPRGAGHDWVVRRVFPVAVAPAWRRRGSGGPAHREPAGGAGTGRPGNSRLTRPGPPGTLADCRRSRCRDALPRGRGAARDQIPDKRGERVLVIVAGGLELRAGAQLLLDAASFQVAPGDKIGLVGRNGAGKTTLARV